MLGLLARLPHGARAHVAGLYRDTLVAQVPLLSCALASEARGNASNDAASPEALAHKLAGSAAMMQDAALSHLARDMEHALRAGDPQAALALLPALEACAAQSLDELAELDGLRAPDTQAAAT
ncbi:hypothetical protein BH11PSE7_BH11PSE7_18100 [soil metagenome]